MLLRNSKLVYLLTGLVIFCANSGIVTGENLQCYHCAGNNCKYPTSEACANTGNNEQCYIYFDPVSNRAIRMGCSSNLTADAVQNDALNYFLCDGDYCNNYHNLPLPRNCYECDSKTDVDCAINPSENTSITLCNRRPHTDCFSRIDQDGHTIRGCISSLNNTEFGGCYDGELDVICRICIDDFCNGNIYPRDRMSCNRCNSTDDPSCYRNPEAQSYCPIFDEFDYCVSKVVDGIVYRGCATEFECDAETTSKTCRECYTYNCNIKVFDTPVGNPGYFQPLPLSCYHCNGTEECSENLGELKQCENNILQTCTTVFNITSGVVISRGCNDTLEDVCEDDVTLCYNCKSNNCNVATLETEYIDCIFCDGQQDATCLTNATAIKQTRNCYKSCVTTLYNSTVEAAPVRQLIRTCLDDLDVADQQICKDGNDVNCKACSSARCNTDAIGIIN